ncbi:hypothetical protein PR048_010426 [Dryococelus australis]|uniref:Uncharacterized protein n=1 Tax=Dryococelus australis TaxID=614101 RepID=A0ABQ9I356_9NEOP|nr:hypothetical protein PR048_010426 [Dryococelus australis]
MRHRRNFHHNDALAEKGITFICKSSYEARILIRFLKALCTYLLSLKETGATVAELLACSPPTSLWTEALTTGATISARDAAELSPCDRGAPLGSATRKRCGNKRIASPPTPPKLHHVTRCVTAPRRGRQLCDVDGPGPAVYLAARCECGGVATYFLKDDPSKGGNVTLAELKRGRLVPPTLAALTHVLIRTDVGRKIASQYNSSPQLPVLYKSADPQGYGKCFLSNLGITFRGKASCALKLQIPSRLLLLWLLSALQWRQLNKDFSLPAGRQLRNGRDTKYVNAIMIPQYDTTVGSRIHEMAQGVEQTAEKIKLDKRFAIQVVESTDICNDGQLIAYVRYFDVGKDIIIDDILR